VSSASNSRVAWTASFVIALACGAVARAGETPGAAAKIESGKKVSIEYTLRGEDGKQVISNVGEEPLVYEAGAMQIPPALEQALAGLAVNDTKHVTIAPQDAYGEIDPKAVKVVPIAEIPEEARKVDAFLIGVDEAGHQRPVRVQKIEGEQVTLDLNHPLAGQTVTFDVKILKIE
jgi:FKBP-type peptidyl-prolyl cis-trans isomerase 2